MVLTPSKHGGKKAKKTAPGGGKRATSVSQLTDTFKGVTISDRGGSPARSSPRTPRSAITNYFSPSSRNRSGHVANGIDSLIKMTAKSTMKAQKYQVMPSNRSAAEYNLSRNIKARLV